MFKKIKNQRGIAIILVLATISLITMIVTDFWSDASISHQMALHSASKVQSYYLAQSAIRFSKLLLYYNKKIEDILKKKNVSLSDMGFEPLYKQIPLSSALLRTMLSSVPSPEESEDGTTGEDVVEDKVVEDTVLSAGDREDEEDSMFSKTEEGVGLLQKDEFESFLDFEGDFMVDISEEESKYSLNYLSKLATNTSSTTTTSTVTTASTTSASDLYKKILLSILMKSDFKNYFENQELDATQLVNAIGDFIDSNTNINEFDGIERGAEDSIYRDVNYHVKNANFLTLSELRLVQGMSDDIFEKLKTLVTVYSANDKINICMADPAVADALIVHYTKYSECTTPLDPEDTEEIEKLRDEILTFCPDKTAVADALNVALGIKEETITDDATTAETKSTSSKVAACKIQFEDLITDSNSIFNIEGQGNVNDVVTTIHMVINAESSKPSAWPILYYQVD